MNAHTFKNFENKFKDGLVFHIICARSQRGYAAAVFVGPSASENQENIHSERHRTSPGPNVLTNHCFPRTDRDPPPEHVFRWAPGGGGGRSERRRTEQRVKSVVCEPRRPSRVTTGGKHPFRRGIVLYSPPLRPMYRARAVQ